ncbi:MAG: ABC-F family ATP-binding cassette domain-containing protein, partial [Saprospiraceae bacterium]|nr:ABC-F family ATP-binding cassette domain-containing protein [Saprospiraceae bacterium]
YYAQNQSEALHSDLTLLETMERHSPPEMRTRLRGILGAFMFSGEDAEKKVTVLSGGERARLALACLLLKPFNLLVLDEPTNHLDMLSKDVLKEALLQYDGTLIVVSHDRDFLAGLTDRTVEFRDHQLFDYLGDVNFFLEKRALNDMREVEKSSAASSNPSGKTAKIEVSYEERKKRLRNLTNAEKKVERLEEQIAGFETQMSDPAFYDRPDAQKEMEAYQKAQKDLKEAVEEWEAAHEAWEEVED